MNCRIERVDSEAGFLTALQHGGVDLVLADFSLPGCDGLEALQLAKQVAPDIPFLIVSGLIGEEAAVDSLRNGATDYILKDRLSRLAPAVRRALDDAGLRRHTKSLGDQLTRAQKLEIFGELAGGVAHDYNNILTIIMANSGLLMAGLAEGTRLHKHASQIEYACAQAATLTRQLLIFSRDRGRDATVLDLNGVVKNAESMLLRLLPENVELAVTLSTGSLSVIADRGDIEQVLINLIKNALEAMHENGTRGKSLILSCAAEGSGVRFSVRDNGCGLPESGDWIFEAFHTTKPAGLGLGLKISQTIIQAHGGRLWAEANKGRGAIFHFHLPLRPETA